MMESTLSQTTANPMALVVTPFIRRHFHERTLGTRIFLAQLPFTLTMALAAALIAFLQPELFTEPPLVTALALSGLLLVVSVAVPWKKMPRGAFLVLPYLDFIAVAFFREGSATLLSSTGLLLLFPVFWLCASGYAPKMAIISGTTASLLIVWIPLVMTPGPVTAAQLVRPLLFPFMVLAFAIAAVALTTSMNNQRFTLIAQDKQLRSSLVNSQQRERLMETIVDTVGVGVVVVDSNGDDVLMNSAQEALHALGVPSGIPNPKEKELLVFSKDRITLPTDARPVRRAILGESFTNYQIWVGSGERAKAVSTTARTIHGPEGTHDGAVIAFHDVTEMVNALAAKDDFVANVSHEFRTPLTAIQSYLAMVLDEPEMDPKEISKYLKVAERNVGRLNSLVADLLTTSTMAVERSRTDVAMLMADSMDSAAPAVAANAVRVELECPQPLLALVDPVRLGQVLDNLVSNAVKYSPDGGTLTARAWVEGTDLHCQIADTGLGMSTTEQAGLFQKFFRAGSAMERGIPGIGLGLMISKTIVETHGGTLTVASEPGLGTTMSVLIPACVLNPSDDC